MDIKDLAQLIEQTLDDNKAADITVLNVRDLTSVTDRMIIATGRSDRHNRALANHVIAAVKEHGIVPLGIEGDEAGQGDWVLLDLADAIVHLMVQDTRDFYNLEALWSQHLPRKSKAQPLDDEE